MEKPKDQPFVSPPKSNKKADIAGASGGTLLLLLAQNLPDNYPYKSWLVVSAPSVTVLIIFLWKLTTKEISLSSKKKKAKKIRLRIVKQIDALLCDPAIREESKIKLRERREQVQLSSVEELVNDLDAIIASA